MKRMNSIDFGSVKVHEKALAEIVSFAVKDIDGVSLVPKNLGHQFLDLCGIKSYPGIDVEVGENEDVVINVKVYVRYGINIPEIARYIQSRVKSIVEKTVDIHLKDINVNIDGITEGIEGGVS